MKDTFIVIFLTVLHKIVTHSNFRNTSAHLGDTRKECLRCAVIGGGAFSKAIGQVLRLTAMTTSSGESLLHQRLSDV